MGKVEENKRRCVVFRRPDEQLVWHASKAPHPPAIGLGFAAENLYGQWAQDADGAKQTEDSGWICLSDETASSSVDGAGGGSAGGVGGSGRRPGSGGLLTICFSIKSPDGGSDEWDGWNAAEVIRLATRMRDDIGVTLLAAVRVHVVSGASKLPLVALPDGLSTLDVTTPKAGIRQENGTF
jgi:hypothetical protein